MTTRTAPVVSLLALTLAACGSDHPFAPTPVCRRYATELTRSGHSYSCRLGGREYSCRGYRTGFSSTYRSLEDFVLEARLPTRPRAMEKSTSWVASFAYMGAGGGRTEYHYDDSGRLLEQRRYAYWNLSPGEDAIDAVEYHSWDSLKRPTSGVRRASDGSTPLSLSYPGRFEMEVSNGESTTWDADGNLLSEVFSDGSMVDYVVTSTEEACL